jgi:hypothetical protein
MVHALCMMGNQGYKQTLKTFNTVLAFPWRNLLSERTSALRLYVHLACAEFYYLTKMNIVMRQKLLLVMT